MVESLNRGSESGRGCNSELPAHVDNFIPGECQARTGRTVRRCRRNVEVLEVNRLVISSK